MERKVSRKSYIAASEASRPHSPEESRPELRAGIVVSGVAQAQRLGATILDCFDDGSVDDRHPAAWRAEPLALKEDDDALNSAKLVARLQGREALRLHLAHVVQPRLHACALNMLKGAAERLLAFRPRRRGGLGLRLGRWRPASGIHAALDVVVARALARNELASAGAAVVLDAPAEPRTAGIVFA